MRTITKGTVAMLVVFATFTASAHAFETAGEPWPGPSPTIAYFDQTDGSEHWAVRKAVAAWNRSGAKFEFIPVPSAEADLIIQEEGRARRHCNGVGSATLGYLGDLGPSQVWIPRNKAKCKYDLTKTAAHELGHVIGLEHDYDECAAMNPYWLCPNLRGDQNGPVQWRCRIVERDDTDGAVSLYGGKVHVRRPAACPLP